jgi:hypothetical protein
MKNNSGITVTKGMIEAAKAAYWHEAHNGGGYSDKCYEAAIQAALSQADYERGILSALSTPTDIEPVAWRARDEKDSEKYWHYFTKEPRQKAPNEIWEPLYAAPDGAHPAWWRGCDHGYAKGLAAAAKIAEKLFTTEFTPQEPGFMRGVGYAAQTIFDEINDAAAAPRGAKE